ncbi:DUF6355 family natural product biosynthesis protein [Streptomyces sp. NPDC127039]
METLHLGRLAHRHRDRRLGPNSERCVVPGVTGIGSSSDIDGAWYTGRTC